jgi:KDO2-lipid IV(A) lauroyltransferase
VLGGDHSDARATARQLFGEFGIKLADLWRFESGRPVGNWTIDPEEWNRFVTAQARGRGVLLVTVHLGNWELGAPLLASKGVKLLVITQAEPGRGFTELRKELRGRWGIETLVIRQDLFAFVEVINRLQAGATIALLIDRPPEPSAVQVEFFGRPFLASIAAAELARATGCAILGVCILRQTDGYEARILPEFVYERQHLGNRAARQRFTQEILRAFESPVRQHASQWYHFVPIWPADPANGQS